MSKKQKPPDEIVAESFEHHLKQLESIVQQLETGHMDLSESLRIFEAGLRHLRHCHQRLHEAEERIALVVKVEADGTARLKDFADPSTNDPPRSGAAKRSSEQEADRLF